MKWWLAFVSCVACSGTAPDLFDSGSDASAVDATSEVVATCPAGKSRCSGACVDTSSDTKNCGACGVTCQGTDVCSASACVTCDKIDVDKDGYNACVDCNDNDPNVNPGAFDVPATASTTTATARSTTRPRATRRSRPTRRTRRTSRTRWTCATRGSPPRRSRRSPTIARTKSRPTGASSKCRWARAWPRSRTASPPTRTTRATSRRKTGTSFGKLEHAYPLTPRLVRVRQRERETDPTSVNDYTELSVSLKVPTNANSFQLDVNYLTTDAPEWLCTRYDDQALILMSSKTMTNADVLLDSAGRHMSVNASYLVLNDAQSLQGTGMEVADTQNQIAGGATGWMTMTVPVDPGRHDHAPVHHLRRAGLDLRLAALDGPLPVVDAKGCAPQTADPLYDGGAPEGGC